MIGLMMLAAAVLDPATRADLTCAEATARTMMREKEGTRAQRGAYVAHFYYLGRLSVRDSSVDWVARIVADAEARPQLNKEEDAVVGACLGIVNGRIASGLPR